MCYIRAVDQTGQAQVGFICGKSKVAPQHGHIIRRLELCAAVLAVELADMVTEQLRIEPENVRYYTDSQVVLGYLYNEERRFFTYVTNRVGRIRKSSDPEQWSYIAAGENPADEGTRCVPPELIMNSTWIKEPTFLAEQDLLQPDSDYALVDAMNDKEIKPSVTSLKTNVSKMHQLGTERFRRFSDWTRLVSVFPMLRHLASSFKTEDKLSCRGWHMCEAYKSRNLCQEQKDIFWGDIFSSEIELLRKGQSATEQGQSSLGAFILLGCRWTLESRRAIEACQVVSRGEKPDIDCGSTPYRHTSYPPLPS